jgi:hypothetical protein
MVKCVKESLVVRFLEVNDEAPFQKLLSVKSSAFKNVQATTQQIGPFILVPSPQANGSQLHKRVGVARVLG